MRCPYCQGTEDRVVDSRSSREGGAVRRRRECLSCGRRFTTYEYVEERQLQVIKRDGTIETFDRRKLLRAIRLACVKRGITNDEIETIVSEVEDELLKRGLDEVESGAIGELVMDRLKTRDHGRLTLILPNNVDTRRIEYDFRPLWPGKVTSRQVLHLRVLHGGRTYYQP